MVVTRCCRRELLMAITMVAQCCGGLRVEVSEWAAHGLLLPLLRQLLVAGHWPTNSLPVRVIRIEIHHLLLHLLLAFWSTSLRFEVDIRLLAFEEYFVAGWGILWRCLKDISVFNMCACLFDRTGRAMRARLLGDSIFDLSLFSPLKYALWFQCQWCSLG